MERIIFYSKDDIASFLQNEKINDYFSNIYPNKSDFEVNDILELYHICHFPKLCVKYSFAFLIQIFIFGQFLKFKNRGKKELIY